MHHWSTCTWNTIAVGAEQNSLLLTDVPQLAFKNEYLLHCILGIASLHQEVLDPTSTEHSKTTVGYRARALSGFREALSGTDGKTLDWEAALMMALLLLILCSKDRNKGADDLTIVNWLHLYRGLSAIINVRSYEDIYITGKETYPFRFSLTRFFLCECFLRVLMKEVLILLHRTIPHLPPRTHFPPNPPRYPKSPHPPPLKHHHLRPIRPRLPPSRALLQGPGLLRKPLRVPPTRRSNRRSFCPHHHVAFLLSARFRELRKRKTPESSRFASPLSSVCQVD